ncbi:CIC11C00000005731 [Sungouiella intermedia]|uniref:RNA helicase n=1 Tax=Sungouiella intermedia TaxID=45354 RepID=A0A1L0DF95_9ASCO|nr:CIC11C00000005731 [[Candida] intermedia]
MSLAGDTSGARKRKRKRSKNVVAHQPEATDVHVNRTNKKIRFDEDLEPSEHIQDEVKEEVEEHAHDVPAEHELVHLEAAEISTDVLKSESNASKRPDTGSQDRTKVIDSSKSEVSTPSPKKNKKKDLKKGKRVFFADDDDDDDEPSLAFNLSSRKLKAAMAERASDLLSIRERLPIYQHKDTIIDYFQQNQVNVIIGETGSGKSTQIPQFLIPLNKKRIAVTQPRRVAAASLATRVSEEHGTPLGHEIGYQVRFSNITSSQTKLNYLTDGMLIRELMLDETLSKYSTVIIDEAHERTVLTDLILGFLKQLILSKKRTDLKIIIMSATLNAELFSKFFDNAPILFVEGKMYPVSRHYLSGSSEDIVDTMVRTVVQINSGEQEGDILCFLPGQEEIDNCVSILNTVAPQLPKEAPLIVPLPLYAALSPAQQSKIFESLLGRKRKVILATNIAETSITVSGVKYVVDSGLRKVKVWKHQLGLSTLLTTPISQASARQRAGRAGRESAGKVFRLYSEKLLLTKLPKQQESEIMRNDVILPILTLKKLGVDDLLNWTWLEHPGQEAILSALSTLHSLGALDNSGKITSLGYKMAVLPLPPALSAVLISALDYGVLHDVIDIASCLSVDNLILNIGGNGELRDEINQKRRQYSPLGNKLGDLIALKEYLSYFQSLNNSKNTTELKLWCKELHFSYKGFRNVLRVRKQLIDYMTTTIRQDDSLSQHEREQQLRKLKAQIHEKDGDSSDDEDYMSDLKKLLDIPLIMKSFLKGYALNTAIGMPDRSFRTCSTGQLISIHPSSNLFGRPNMDAIMYIEYVYTAKAYGRNCSAIELSWLQEAAPHLLGSTKISINE